MRYNRHNGSYQNLPVNFIEADLSKPRIYRYEQTVKLYGLLQKDL